MKHYYLKTILVFSFLFTVLSCSTDDEVELQAPNVTSETTSGNVEITFTSIEVKGNVSSPGNDITARGVCWSTNQNPTTSGNKTTEVSNTFTSTINDLVANTTYYFRVYATNSIGTTYGTEQSFNTSSLDGSMWDFFFNHDPNNNNTWHGDVIFNADGTAVYDEPDYPGMYTMYGTWFLSGNILSYDFDSSEPTNTSYQFTGTILNNTMSGFYNWGPNPDKTFTATKY